VAASPLLGAFAVLGGIDASDGGVCAGGVATDVLEDAPGEASVLGSDFLLQAASETHSNKLASTTPQYVFTSFLLLHEWVRLTLQALCHRCLLSMLDNKHKAAPKFTPKNR
jgi:hypothetical protein